MGSYGFRGCGVKCTGTRLKRVPTPMLGMSHTDAINGVPAPILVGSWEWVSKWGGRDDGVEARDMETDGASEMGGFGGVRLA